MRYLWYLYQITAAMRLVCLYSFPLFYYPFIDGMCVHANFFYATCNANGILSAQQCLNSYNVRP